jgi:hypothetical protein
MGDGCGVATLAAGSCLPRRGNSDADEAVHPTRLKIDGQDAASAEIDFASLHRACDSNRAGWSGFTLTGAGTTYGAALTFATLLHAAKDSSWNRRPSRRDFARRIGCFHPPARPFVSSCPGRSPP